MAYSLVAITSARMAAKKWGVPASVQLGQYELESGGGVRMPPGSNNPFGVKAVNGQPFVTAKTTEMRPDGSTYQILAAFAKYPSLVDAFDEHARELAKGTYLSPAMVHLPDITAYVTAMATHYATDKDYASKLLSIIHRDNLTQYDQDAPVVASQQKA